MIVHLALWIILAKESRAPVSNISEVLKSDHKRPLRAILKYRHGWYMGLVMFSLAAAWTSTVTFLPTILQDDRGVAITTGASLLGFMYYALIPGSLLGGYIYRRVPNRKVLLSAPVIVSASMAGLASITSQPIILAAALTGIGLAWVAVPAIEMLPFEIPGIQPREVTVISALSLTLFGLGFATGPVIVGAIAEISGSVPTGLLILNSLTGLGVLAGIFYPRYRQSTE